MKICSRLEKKKTLSPGSHVVHTAVHNGPGVQTNAHDDSGLAEKSWGRLVKVSIHLIHSIILSFLEQGRKCNHKRDC